MKFRYSSLIICLICSLSFGCAKLVEVSAPVTSTNADNVFESDATAAAVLTGIYTKLSAADYSPFSADNFSGLNVFTGLLSDELVLYNQSNTGYYPFYKNDLTSLVQTGLYWNAAYQYIYRINSALEGVANSRSLSYTVKQQLIGEAKFLRGFFYFYLSNLYGDVPLILSSDWKQNSIIAKSPKALVQKQIVEDLTSASNLLSENFLKADLIGKYSAGTDERVRPTRWAAEALLARVALYMSDWPSAELHSTNVISKQPLFGLSPLSNVFSKNSLETIWSIQPVNSGNQANTGYGALMLLPVNGPDNTDYPIYLSPQLANSFESGDLRKLNWIDSVKNGSNVFHYSKKYRIGKVSAPTQEYVMVLRLAEQYLIRSEARARQNKFSEALTDLNLLRNRANLPSYGTIATLQPLLQAIVKERRAELFTEWGDRWMDLSRTGDINSVMASMSLLKGITWSDFKALLPIPQSEISRNPLLTQNNGY